jgi:TolA-binding protein
MLIQDVDRYPVVHTSGDYAGAEQLYRQLLNDLGDLPEADIKFALARSLEFQGNKKEAGDLYLTIATDYRDKDQGRNAIDRLAALDPSLLEKLPPEPKK